MDSIVKRFSEHLESIEYPKSKTSWNIAGIIKGQNAFYRFDIRETAIFQKCCPLMLGWQEAFSAHIRRVGELRNRRITHPSC